MARPSSPNSPEQAYRLSADGLDLLAQLNSWVPNFLSF
jgi:hypothetical protein